MDVVKLCSLNFDRIEELLAGGLRRQGKARLRGWFAHELVGAVLSLQKSPAFRQAARWSLDHLAPKGNGRERLQLVTVDKSLRSLAAELWSVSSAWDAEQAASFPPEALRAVACAASDGWIDLARREDYFESATDLHLRNEDELLQRSFERFARRQGKLGDAVHRNAFARIAFWRSMLEEVLAKILDGLGQGSPGAERLREARENLDRQIRVLEADCFAADARLTRETAVSLVQVYAALDRSPVLHWFPVDVDLRAGGDRLRAAWGLGPRPGTEVGGARPKAKLSFAREVAAVVADARAFEMDDGSATLLDRAKSEFRLVIVDGDRRLVYWDGKPVREGEWERERTHWSLLLRFASRPGQLLPRLEDHGGTMRSQVSRLRTFLLTAADGLEARLQTVRREGYRLDLPSRDIRILRPEDSRELEIGGRGRRKGG